MTGPPEPDDDADALAADLNRICEAHRTDFARRWVSGAAYGGVFGALATGRGFGRRTITADGAVLGRAATDFDRFLADITGAALAHCQLTNAPFESLEDGIRRAVQAYIGETSTIMRPDDGTGSLTPGVAAALERYRAECLDRLAGALDAGRRGNLDPRLAAATSDGDARAPQFSWMMIFLVLLILAWFLFGRLL